MLFWRINSFFHTESSEKSFISLIAFNLLMEDRQKNCSKFLGTANYHSKNCGELMGGTNYHSKIPSKLSRTANYRSKICVDWDNRHHENMGKFPWNIVSSGISSKSQEKPGISLKFTCITFAQDCNMSTCSSEMLSKICHVTSRLVLKPSR